jgi:hypothetical protein
MTDVGQIAPAVILVNLGVRLQMPESQTDMPCERLPRPYNTVSRKSKSAGQGRLRERQRVPVCSRSSSNASYTSADGRCSTWFANTRWRWLVPTGIRCSTQLDDG